MLKSKHSNFYMTLLLVCVLLLFSIFLVNQVGVLGDAKRVINKGITTEPDPIQEIKVEEKLIIKDPIDVKPPVNEIVEFIDFLNPKINEYNQSPPDIKPTDDIIVVDLLYESDVDESYIDSFAKSVTNSESKKTEEQKFFTISQLGLNQTYGEVGDPKIYSYLVSDILPANKYIKSIDIYYFDPVTLDTPGYLEPVSAVYNRNYVALNDLAPPSFNSKTYSLDVYPEKKYLNFSIVTELGLDFYNLDISPIEYFPKKNQINIYNFKIIFKLADLNGKREYYLSNFNSLDYDNIKTRVSIDRSFDKFIYNSSSSSEHNFESYSDYLAKNEDLSEMMKNIDSNNASVTRPRPENIFIYADHFEPVIPNFMGVIPNKAKTEVFVSVGSILTHSWPEFISATPNLHHDFTRNNDYEACLFFYNLFKLKDIDPDVLTPDHIQLKTVYYNRGIDPQIKNVGGFIPKSIPANTELISGEIGKFNGSWEGTISSGIIPPEILDQIINFTSGDAPRLSLNCQEINANRDDAEENPFCHKDSEVVLNLDWSVDFTSDACSDSSKNLTGDDSTSDLVFNYRTDYSNSVKCRFAVMNNDTEAKDVLNSFYRLFDGVSFDAEVSFSKMEVKGGDQGFQFVYPFTLGVSGSSSSGYYPKFFKETFLSQDITNFSTAAEYVVLPVSTAGVLPPTGYNECVTSGVPYTFEEMYVNFLADDDIYDSIQSGVNHYNSNDVFLHWYNGSLIAYNNDFENNQNSWGDIAGNINLRQGVRESAGIDMREPDSRTFYLHNIKSLMSCLDGKYPEDFTVDASPATVDGFYYCSRPYFSESPAAKIRNYILYQTHLSSLEGLSSPNFIIVGDSDTVSIMNNPADLGSNLSYSTNTNQFTFNRENIKNVPLKNLTYLPITTSNVESVIRNPDNQFYNTVKYQLENPNLPSQVGYFAGDSNPGQYNLETSISAWTYKKLYPMYYTLNSPVPPVGMNIQTQHDLKYGPIQDIVLSVGDVKKIVYFSTYDRYYGPSNLSMFSIDLDRNISSQSVPDISYFFPSVYYYRIDEGTNMNLDYCQKVTRTINQDVTQHGIYRGKTVGSITYCEPKQAVINSMPIVNAGVTEQKDVYVPLDHIFGSPDITMSSIGGGLSSRSVSNLGGSVKNYISILPVSSRTQIEEYVARIREYRKDMGLSQKKPYFFSYSTRDCRYNEHEYEAFKLDLVESYTLNSLFRKKYMGFNTGDNSALPLPYIQEYTNIWPTVNYCGFPSEIDYLGFTIDKSSGFYNSIYFQHLGLTNFIFYSGHSLMNSINEVHFDRTGQDQALKTSNPGMFYSSSCLAGQYTNPHGIPAFLNTLPGSTSFLKESICHNIPNCSVVEQALFGGPTSNNVPLFTKFIGHTNVSFVVPANNTIISSVLDDSTQYHTNDSGITSDVIMSTKLFKYDVQNEGTQINLSLDKHKQVLNTQNSSLGTGTPTANISTLVNVRPGAVYPPRAAVSDLYTIAHFGLPSINISEELKTTKPNERAIVSANFLHFEPVVNTNLTNAVYQVDVNTSKSLDLLTITPYICYAEPSKEITDFGALKDISNSCERIPMLYKEIDLLTINTPNTANNIFSLLPSHPAYEFSKSLIGLNYPIKNVSYSTGYPPSSDAESFLKYVYLVEQDRTASNNLTSEISFLVSIDKQYIETSLRNLVSSNTITTKQAYMFFVLNSVDSAWNLGFSGIPNCMTSPNKHTCNKNDVKDYVLPLTFFDCGVDEFKNDRATKLGNNPKCNDNFKYLNTPNEELFHLLQIS